MNEARSTMMRIVLGKPICMHMYDELLREEEFNGCRRDNGGCRGVVRLEPPDPITYEDNRLPDGTGTFIVKRDGKPERIWIFRKESR